MIYLMESHDKLKIGYAKDIKKRYKTLSTGNIDLTIKDTKPGTIKDEKLLQKKCLEWKINREWYQNVPEVIKAFEEYDPYDPENPEIKEFIEDVKQYSNDYDNLSYLYLIHNILLDESFREKLETAPEWLNKYIECAKDAMMWLDVKLIKNHPECNTFKKSDIKLQYQTLNSFITVDWIGIADKLFDIRDDLTTKAEKLHEICKQINEDLSKCLYYESKQVLQNLLNEYINKTDDCINRVGNINVNLKIIMDRFEELMKLKSED